MTMHRFHAGLPGYREDSVFHDGCEACEERVADLRTLLNYTDGENIAQLWGKMARLHQRESDRRGGEWREQRVEPMSEADLTAISHLWVIAQFIAKYGHDDPWLADYVVTTP